MAVTLVERFCFPKSELSGLPTMPEYRSYFRDSDGKIKGTQILDCEDDTAAAVKLEILPAERQNCATADVWQDEDSSIAPYAQERCDSDAFLLAMTRRISDTERSMAH